MIKNSSGYFDRLHALSSLKYQAGFLIPLALFIVVSAATLGVAMGQLAAGSRSSAILLALNAQALFAADAGVHLGARYADSPLCVPDGTPEPPDDPTQVVPSSWPGSRAPHAWLAPGRSTLRSPRAWRARRRGWG